MSTKISSRDGVGISGEGVGIVAALFGPSPETSIDAPTCPRNRI